MSSKSRNSLLFESIIDEELFEYFCLTGFPYLSREKHLIDNTIDLFRKNTIHLIINLIKYLRLLNGIYFIEVEDEIQFANVMEVFVEDFDKVMNGFEIYQIVVI